MAYNVGTLVTRVQRKLEDDEYDQNVIIDFLNDIHREVLTQYRFPFMERTFSGTLTSGSTTYTLPADTFKIISFRVTSPDDRAVFLPYMEFREFDRVYPDPSSANDGSPKLWTMVGSSFRLYPAPDTDYELDLRYLATPTTLTVTADVPDIPEVYQEIMVLGAYKRTLYRNDDFSEAQIIQQDIDDLIEKMVKAESQKQIGTPHVMRSNKNRSVQSTTSQKVARE